MRSDGTADHAGNSRWKAGAGTAGAGLLAGLAKFGALPYLALKAFLIFRLVHLATLGGAATILGIVAIVVLIGGSLLRTGRRLHL